MPGSENSIVYINAVGKTIWLKIRKLNEYNLPCKLNNLSNFYYLV